jgi:hypothetical protein
MNWSLKEGPLAASRTRALPPFWALGIGVLAGAAATGAMSLVMAASQRAGLMGRMPPKKITEAALEGVGAEAVPEPAVNVLSTVAHVGFGSGSGALFALTRRQLRSRFPLADGLLFGTAVWLTSYAGWVPALGIMQPPTRDRPGRPTSMLLAHWVYGAVLGSLVVLGERELRARH